MIATAASALAAAPSELPLERTTLRIVSHRLIPFLFVLYVVSFLDRVNVGFASLKMNRDLGRASLPQA
jgi:ACS family tartrate transporter-like MFS transporter